MAPTMRVLISGAGIAGPTLAWFLARAGARVTVVEKARALLPHGQNIDIEGSAVSVIKKMGLYDEIKRLNTTEKGTQFIDPKGRPFGLLPVKEGSTFSPTSELEILRGDLAAILYDASKDHPNVSYKFDTTVANVISNNDDAVKVELSDGETQEYDLLVAADGQWSKVRRQCFPADSVTVVDKGMYVTYWTVPRIPSDNDWWNIYHALGSRVITLRPDPHGTTRAAFAHMPRNAAQKAAWEGALKGGSQVQQDFVKKEFADAGWQAQRLLDAMDQAPDFYFQAVQQIRMTKWSSSRVICLGDAGYAPTPLTGMGTSLAILGGYVLAGELSKLSSGENPTKALEAYEAIFRPFVEKIQGIPFFIPSIAHPGSALKRWLLQTGISTMSKVVALIVGTPWLAKRFDSSSEENTDGFTLPSYPALDGEKAA